MKLDRVPPLRRLTLGRALLAIVALSLVLAVALFVFVLRPVSVLAASQAQTQPVVSGVFFYSPNCSHCHEVMDNHWPAIEQEFDDALHMLFVDVTTEEGAQILQQTLGYMGMTPTGVPLLIIGNEVMVGSLDIPVRAPEVIRAGLQAGGVRFPPIPALLARYDREMSAATIAASAASAQSVAEVSAVPTSADTSPQAVLSTASEEEVPAASSPAIVESAAEALAAIDTSSGAPAGATTATGTLSILERITRDPIANAIAIVVLLLLAFSLILFVGHRLTRRDSASRWSALGTGIRAKMLILVAILGVGVAIAVIAGALASPAIVALAVVQAIAFAIVLMAFAANRTSALSTWLLPIAAGAGMLVAGYLAYVEATANPAVCGIVGDCNVVQQSQYATLLGIPIGVLGMIGYALLLVIALLRIWSPGILAGDNSLLEIVAVAGVAFSAYLTFLEPFVIGASCAWCLLSALWMLAIFWLVTDWQHRESKVSHTPRHKAGGPRPRHA